MTEENVNAAPEGGEGGGSDAPVKLPQIRDAAGHLRDMNATELKLAERYGWLAKKSAEAKKAAEDDDDPKAEPYAGEEENEQQQDEDDETEKLPSGLSVPFGIPEKFMEETTAHVEAVGKLGKELGVAQDTVQTLVDYAVELAGLDSSRAGDAVGRAVTAESFNFEKNEAGKRVVSYKTSAAENPTGLDLSDESACMKTLLSRYGRDGGTKVVKDARAAVLRLGPKAVQFLDSTGLGNSPAILMALAAYQRGDLHMSPETAQAELDKITKGEDLRSKPYFNSDDPKNKLVKDRVALLYMRLAKGEGVEAKPKAEAAKKDAVSANMAKLDEEIRLAILDPAYRDANHPKHRDAVDRATALYERRYRDEG